MSVLTPLTNQSAHWLARGSAVVATLLLAVGTLVARITIPTNPASILSAASIAVLHAAFWYLVVLARLRPRYSRRANP